MVFQTFGGNWTNKKLKILKKYLVAYSTIMNKQPFTFAYIDAFAGTGYRSPQQNENANLPLSDIITEENDFIKGSATVALEVVPQFQKYIFIEKDTKQFKELSKLKNIFPQLTGKIKMINEDANFYIQKICKKDWSKNRAVMFLDPFGMEIEWNTVKAIADTKSIDLWILFPLGIGVNRLLKRNGQLEEWAKNKLNNLFGTNEWRESFYKKSSQQNFFNEEELNKIADFETIGNYFISRLQSIFTKVAQNPAELRNSKGNPLFLLCFSAGNPRGADTAVKIAQDILKKI